MCAALHLFNPITCQLHLLFCPRQTEPSLGQQHSQQRAHPCTANMYGWCRPSLCWTGQFSPSPTDQGKVVLRPTCLLSLSTGHALLQEARHYASGPRTDQSLIFPCQGISLIWLQIVWWGFHSLVFVSPSFTWPPPLKCLPREWDHFFRHFSRYVDGQYSQKEVSFPIPKFVYIMRSCYYVSPESSRFKVEIVRLSMQLQSLIHTPSLMYFVSCYSVL